MRRQAFVATSLVAIAIAIVVPAPDLRAQASTTYRAATAAAIAMSAYEEWLGPRAGVESPKYRASRFDSARSMSVESEVAFELATRWFNQFEKNDPAVVDGLAWYLQSRVVERAFDRAFLAPGYRFQTACLFGCYVRWSFRPLIVGRWGDGLGRPEFVRTWSGREWPALDRRPATTFARRSLALALAFGALERELGWPALQGALRAAASATDGRPLSEILEDATGRDLDAVFRLAGDAPIDHRLGEMTTLAGTGCVSRPCFLTRIHVARGGELPFPIALRVDFEDGSEVSVAWKGDDETFEFESTSPPVRARLDPGRIWLLDPDFANNDADHRTRSRSPLSAKWFAQWMLWLQDAMLASTFPV
jgi:hypothetical protein